MGFLDHSTNNIIIDAVLTDEGRRLLAKNDGSFRISMFSLGDDEVDYGIIQKFGRAVGKEKISKNTPVFEAQTKKELAIKHRLLTLPDQTITHLPVLEISGFTDAASNTLAFSPAANARSRTLTITQTMAGNVDSSVPDGLADTTFSVLIPDRFLTLTSTAGFVSLTPNSRIATYKVNAQRVNGGASLALDIRMRDGLDPTVFSIFGTKSSNRQTIQSVVSVVGDQSGVRVDFNVQVNQTAN